jgi:hypothetical protein
MKAFESLCHQEIASDDIGEVKMTKVINETKTVSAKIPIELHNKINAYNTSSNRPINITRTIILALEKEVEKNEV